MVTWMKIDFLLVNEIKQIYFETNFKHILTFQSLHSIIIQANAFKSMTSSTWQDMILHFQPQCWVYEFEKYV